MVNSIKDLQKLIVSGFTDWKTLGDVSVRGNGDLLLFNYTPQAQFANRWNALELISRGLIIHKLTGEIVARPFDKFFNWGENNRTSEADILTVTEKMDGSLGILYRQDGEHKIATRGSFDSEQAQWATEFLNKHYNLRDLAGDITLLFEIIYPENRIVIDYGNEQALYLLAMRNRETGKYLPFWQVETAGAWYGFPVAKIYDFSDPDDILGVLSNLNANQEGYVVEFSDGQRFKFKGDRYKELHRLISDLSFKNTLAAVQTGTTDAIRSAIPDEFTKEFDGWVQEINTTIVNIKARVKEAMVNAPLNDRKTFALWVRDNHPDLSSFLFASLDGRDITPIIFKQAFRD